MPNTMVEALALGQRLPKNRALLDAANRAERDDCKGGQFLCRTESCGRIRVRLGQCRLSSYLSPLPTDYDNVEHFNKFESLLIA